ncbi:Regulator of chromosome condensation (RCC1) repeat-containing protein [Nannocystis exedens]|uniref:Regulator of chromosome condensation (RCC1) repeat-containing protein n=1 Tax=Nannocystis exedens TaxID=54 RepID=A0A1I2IYS7_9BACT|nr:Regulator of chromosome condensation (RCC1) repeat-containing protein [Nannocystis exedens]
MFCWGLNRQGLLGVGEPDLEDILRPRRVPGLPPVVQVASDYDFTCALAEDHAVYCWGDNGRGQLGIGDVALQTTPARLADLAADRLVVDFGRVCAGRGAAFFCWGRGEFGDGHVRQQPFPLEIAALAGVDDLALAGAHGCTLKAGEVRCWGHNVSGQLGNGQGGCRYKHPLPREGRRLPPKECKHEPVPVRAVGLPPIVELALGGYFSHARDEVGRIWRWGQQGERMDYGEDLAKYRPYALDGLPPMAELAAGEAHACARTADGELWCWGNNSFGQLGHAPVPGESSEQIARVGGLPPVRALALGFHHTCALAGASADVRVWCWGDNSDGQLGDGTTERRHTPVQVRWD